MSSLRDAIKERQATVAAPVSMKQEQIPVVEPVRENIVGAYSEGNVQSDLSLPTDADLASMRVRGIDVECIVGGCLMRVSFKETTNPADVPVYLRAVDPNVKFRDEFPRSGMGGPREIKSAHAFTISIDWKGDYKRASIVCTTDVGDAVTVDVSKKAIEDFPVKLLALGCLSERSAAMAKKAFDDKGNATLILSEPEKFTVKYVEFGGKGMLEEMVTEPVKNTN